MNRVASWLHRHGIARTLNSGSSTYNPNVDYLMEGRPWTPRWLIVWAANHSFRQMYPSRTAQLCLARVRRHETAVDGTRRWSLEYRPADRGAAR
jgi:hypothetical protein